MANVVPANVQIPAHLAGRIGVPSALAASLTGGLSSGVSVPRISIKGSRFRIVEGELETVLDSTTLDVVVVGANPRLSKAWYAAQWTPDSEPQAPDCYSLDGVGPHPESTMPQNDLCATCSHNAWGSKVTPLGQQIKACADQKRLAVVSAEDPSGPVYLLQVTPAALKGLNQYQKELSVRGIPPEIVKTRVSFDTDASFPKLKFTFGGFLDAATQEVVDGLFGSAAVCDVTGESTAVVAPTAPTASPLPVAAVVRTPATPAPAPAPAPAAKRGFVAAQPAAPAPAPATAVRRGRPPAQAAVAAPADAAAAQSLADEIAALVGDADADDA